MNGAADNPKWILQCRDLVQLYYGARMVTAVIEKEPPVNTSNFLPLIAQDSRRIRYEIILANEDAAAQTVDIGTILATGGFNFQEYSIPPGDTKVIERDFLTDLDAVTLALICQPSSLNVVISTRETFLTPLPADES